MRVLDSPSGRPTVLMVTNMWPHPGNTAYGIFVKRQIESLRTAGLDCEVIFVRGFASRRAYFCSALELFVLNFRRRRPRLVHAHGGETGLVARCFLRGPVITSYCGDDLLGTPTTDGSLTRASRIRRWTLRRHARSMTATITKSSEMEAALPSAVRSRNSVLPNGVDRTLFFPRPRRDARTKLGWEDGERVVLFAADPTVERKRYGLAKAACRAAEATVGPIRLKVAWGVPPVEMPLLMAGADCLLLTSAIEGSPNVVKEAVTCGLPVISTPVGDVAQVLERVQPSWICPATPGALSAGLVDLFQSTRRTNGWEASVDLGQEAIASRLLQLYERIMRG